MPGAKSPGAATTRQGRRRCGHHPACVPTARAPSSSSAAPPPGGRRRDRARTPRIRIRPRRVRPSPRRDPAPWWHPARRHPVLRLRPFRLQRDPRVDYRSLSVLLLSGCVALPPSSWGYPGSPAILPRRSGALDAIRHGGGVIRSASRRSTGGSLPWGPSAAFRRRRSTEAPVTEGAAGDARTAMTSATSRARPGAERDAGAAGLGRIGVLLAGVRCRSAVASTSFPARTSRSVSGMPVARSSSMGVPLPGNRRTSAPRC